jgi:GlpG protein
MTHEAAPDRDPCNVAGDEVAAPEPGTRPWATYVIIVFCIGIFIGLNQQEEPSTWENLSRFGAPSSDVIWSGAWWALITTAFVHVALWHLAFNLYWLWALGGELERAIGSLRYLGFILGSAVVSSGCELAMSGTTGIGASGAVYAIFGFMCLAKERHPKFKEVLDAQTITIFIIWLIACIPATLLNVVSIGNAAHISGLSFGAGVAAAFVLKWKRPLVFAGLGALAALAITALFWCPWSVNWLAFQAYDAHNTQEFDLALERYTQVIARDPENAWAYQNRSDVHAALGNSEAAAADLQKAREIDPSIQAEQ